jgi:predicted transcriptional regulator
MIAKVMKVGIISKEDYVKRTMEIAKGKYKPRENEPKIWFESLKSMSQVLSSDNQNLLKVIIEHNPRSLAELEKLSDRKNPIYQELLKPWKDMGLLNSLKKKEG